MPSEAQIKAQIQAALAKKKQTSTSSSATTSSTPPSTPTPKPAEVETPKPPKVEVKSTPASVPVEMVNALTPAIVSETTPVATDTSLVFGGQAIRFTTSQNHVYFAVVDLLQLARDSESNNKFIDFLNNPKTKDEAEKLTKILTFKDENGSDKTHGATALSVIKIFHALELRAPGPLGRWLNEVSDTHLQR